MPWIQCTTSPQGKEGNRGDALMPLLFSLGRAGERFVAWFHDVYVVARPDCVPAVYSMSQEELWRHARIRIHGDKTQVWK